MDHVEQLLKYVLPAAQRDERGLVPLERARATLAALTPEAAAGLSMGAADPVWAAILSLADAGEALAELRRLRFAVHPRGHDNVALHERYGDAILPFVADHHDPAARTLTNVPWNVIPVLLRIGAPEALSIVLEIDSIVQPHPEVSTPEKLVAAFVDRHPAIAWAELGRRVLAGDARAIALTKKLARGRGTTALGTIARALGADARDRIAKQLKLVAKVDAKEILAVLEGAVARGDWPRFVRGDASLEHHAMRIVAAREGDRWGIAIERLCGSDWERLVIERYRFGSEVSPGLAPDVVQPEIRIEGPVREAGAASAAGSTIQGPRGALTPSEADLARLDVRPGRSAEAGGGGAEVVLVRAYLAEHPGSLWPRSEETLAALGLGAGARLLAQSDAFAHAESAPSRSKTFKSIASAIERDDPSGIELGKPNADWRARVR